MRMRFEECRPRGEVCRADGIVSGCRSESCATQSWQPIWDVTLAEWTFERILLNIICCDVYSSTNAIPSARGGRCQFRPVGSGRVHGIGPRRRIRTPLQPSQSPGGER